MLQARADAFHEGQHLLFLSLAEGEPHQVLLHPPRPFLKGLLFVLQGLHTHLHPVTANQPLTVVFHQSVLPFRDLLLTPAGLENALFDKRPAG